jgi:hypothetical protein
MVKLCGNNRELCLNRGSNETRFQAQPALQAGFGGPQSREAYNARFRQTAATRP